MSDLTSLSKEDLLLLVPQQQEMISHLLNQIEDLKREIDRLKGGGKPRPTSPDWTNFPLAKGGTEGCSVVSAAPPSELPYPMNT